MVRLSALDFDLSPDFEPRFADSDITGPIFDELAEKAREDEELGLLFRRACRQMLRSEKVRGFLAGERIRDRVTAMVSLMLAADGWSVRDLASPEEAEEHFQEILRGIKIPFCFKIRREPGGSGPALGRAATYTVPYQQEKWRDFCEKRL